MPPLTHAAAPTDRLEDKGGDGSAGLLEGDGVAECLELGDGVAFGAVGVSAVVVVGSEVGVDLSGGAHVPDRGEQGAFEGDEGAGCSAPAGDAVVLGG